MGNTVSKVVDIGLQAVCVATGGLLGKSNEGYHLGPFRFNKDSVGFEFKVGVCGVSISVGTNDFGRNGIDASISYGIPGVAEGSIRTGIDTDGLYGGLSGSLNVGPLKTGGSIVANGQGIRSYSANVKGPLLTNVNYSNTEGVSGGIFGASVNTAGEIQYKILEKEFASAIGYKLEDEFELYQEERQRERDKKAIREILEYEQKYLGKNNDKTLENEYKLYLERREREKEKDALKDKKDERKKNNLVSTIWQKFDDEYNLYQERKQRVRHEEVIRKRNEYERKVDDYRKREDALKKINEYERIKLDGKKNDDSLKKANRSREVKTSIKSDKKELNKKESQPVRDEGAFDKRVNDVLKSTESSMEVKTSFERVNKWLFNSEWQRRGDEEALSKIAEYEKSNLDKRVNGFLKSVDSSREVTRILEGDDKRLYKSEWQRRRDEEALRKIDEYRKSNLHKRVNGFLKSADFSREVTRNLESDKQALYKNEWQHVKDKEALKKINGYDRKSLGEKFDDGLKGGAKQAREMRTKTVRKTGNVNTISNRIGYKTGLGTRPMNVDNRYSPYCRVCNGPCKFNNLSK